MEVVFDNRDILFYNNSDANIKRIQESSETVVPDTNDDISKIAAVQSSVFLKSKDITPRGVLITGEATASVLYITENQDKISSVKLSRSFSIEYDMDGIDPDTVAQVRLSLLANETRIINPRKLSVCFDICSELYCYVKDNMSVESRLPPEACRGLHANYESAELNLISSVCEKTFSMNESFVFASGKPKACKIVSCKTAIIPGESQSVGTKAIVKGNVKFDVCYLSDEVNYPLRAEFSAPFSQLVELGEEQVESICVIPAVTGIYHDISESISGEMLFELELHAVLQLVCRSRNKLIYISDAYSNLMESSCACQKIRLVTMKEKNTTRLVCDERINVGDDCADVLCIFVTPGKAKNEQGRIKTGANLDIVFRTSNSGISSVKRFITLENECAEPEIKLGEMWISDMYLRPDGQCIDVHIAIEQEYTVNGTVEFNRGMAIELDEDRIIDTAEYPALTLVRCEGESLWELAKKYHSSVESIAGANDIDVPLSGRMIMIPKSI